MMTPGTSSQRARIARLAADIAQLRLPPSDVGELRYFFNEFEADIGVRSLHFAQFDAMTGYRGTRYTAPRRSSDRSSDARLWRAAAAVVAQPLRSPRDISRCGRRRRDEGLAPSK